MCLSAFNSFYIDEILKLDITSESCHAWIWITLLEPEDPAAALKDSHFLASHLGAQKCDHQPVPRSYLQ